MVIPNRAGVSKCTESPRKMSTFNAIKSKSFEEFAVWLAQEGFSQKTCTLFEGWYRGVAIFMQPWPGCENSFTENEIDDEAFLLLTKKEIE